MMADQSSKLLNVAHSPSFDADFYRSITPHTFRTVPSSNPAFMRLGGWVPLSSSVINPARSLFRVAPPMHGLDIVWMIVSPGSSHPFRVLVVRYDVAIFSKFLVADCAFAALLGDLPVQQFPHFSGRS